MEKLAEFAAWAGRTLGHGPAIILFVVTMTAGPKVIEWLFEKASNNCEAGSGCDPAASGAR
jgi:hypothetical protein